MEPKVTYDPTNRKITVHFVIEDGTPRVPTFFLPLGSWEVVWEVDSVLEFIAGFQAASALPLGVTVPQRSTQISPNQWGATLDNQSTQLGSFNYDVDMEVGITRKERIHDPTIVVVPDPIG